MTTWLNIVLQAIPVIVIVLAMLLRIEHRLTRVETKLELLCNNKVKGKEVNP